jgi:peptide/nickel transport system ATP-binding protein/oligopeptide transport system ATP-binding protein
VVERCRTEVPQLKADGTGHALRHEVACHRAAELPSAEGVVPSDGGFSPALEKLVAAFSLSEEGPAGGGVDIVGRPAV